MCRVVFLMGDRMRKTRTLSATARLVGVGSISALGLASVGVVQEATSTPAGASGEACTGNTSGLESCVGYKSVTGPYYNAETYNNYPQGSNYYGYTELTINGVEAEETSPAWLDAGPPGQPGEQYTLYADHSPSGTTFCSYFFAWTGSSYKNETSYCFAP